MKICLLEPFYSGSHKTWADSLVEFSSHEIRILSLPGRHWKWRMHGGAVSLAQQFLKLNFTPDLILGTDMIDFSVFLSLSKFKSSGIPTAIYFHENQLTYPWSPSDQDVDKKRDNHYAFINYTSALSADHIFFNSNYHQKSFISSLPKFLSQFPDEQGLELVLSLSNKSKVLPLGLNLSKLDRHLVSNTLLQKNILWNHRWEYDKNPEMFFKLLIQLSKEGFDYGLSVVGQSYKNSPEIFDAIKSKLGKHLLHFGFQKSFSNYAKVLKESTILPVTSNQDFFGGSVVEAIYTGAYPVLPNRLAYPEHIPKEFHTAHLYNSKEELGQILRAILAPDFKLGANESLINFVRKYDWKTLIELYDRTFENISF